MAKRTLIQLRARRRPAVLGSHVTTVLLAAGFAVTFGALAPQFLPGEGGSGEASVPSPAVQGISFHVAMPQCGAGKRVTCIVDGDTVWLEGEKIRLEGFNTPELRGACARERSLALAAMRRLGDLLHKRPFTLVRSGGKDRYDRTLATIQIDGSDVGDILVAERLAHRWHGYKEDWCEA